MKYHYFYKITNNINNHYYFGVHSTSNLDDGYMGSGTRLHLAYKKYGIENFTKVILKFFDSKEEAFAYEAEVVNEELIETKDCYNLTTGGKGFDSDKIFCKDCKGNMFYISKTDERYISGSLKFICNDRKLSDETKQKISNKAKLAHANTHYGAGTKNSQYGKRWIHNDSDEKLVAKEELSTYLEQGWKLGMGNRIWVNCNGKNTIILEKYKDEYLSKGWSLGSTRNTAVKKKDTSTD